MRQIKVYNRTQSAVLDAIYHLISLQIKKEMLGCYTIYNDMRVHNRCANEIYSPVRSEVNLPVHFSQR